MVLGLGDGAGGGERGGVGGGGGWELQQRHGRLYKDNEAISRAWKCLLLWRISTLSGAFKQKEAREKKKKGRGGGGGGGGFLVDVGLEPTTQKKHGPADDAIC